MKTDNKSKTETKSYIGHRDRVREVIAASGIGGFLPYQVLEYILFHAIPYKDTKEIAYKLLNKFGSFADVLHADLNSLVEVNGMTRNAALLLKCIPDICDLYQKSKNEPKLVLNANSALPFIQSLYKHITEERMYLLSLDEKFHLLHTDLICDGNEVQVDLPVQEIAKIAFRHGAHSVIITHNHPSSVPHPSPSDISSTVKLAEILTALNIKLIDHIIMGKDYAHSMAMKCRLSVIDGSYPIDSLEIDQLFARNF